MKGGEKFISTIGLNTCCAGELPWWLSATVVSKQVEWLSGSPCNLGHIHSGNSSTDCLKVNHGFACGNLQFKSREVAASPSLIWWFSLVSWYNKDQDKILNALCNVIVSAGCNQFPLPHVVCYCFSLSFPSCKRHGADSSLSWGLERRHCQLPRRPTGLTGTTYGNEFSSKAPSSAKFTAKRLDSSFHKAQSNAFCIRLQLNSGFQSSVYSRQVRL